MASGLSLKSSGNESHRSRILLPKNRNQILKRVQKVCAEREDLNLLCASENVVSEFPEYFPFDIRSLLSTPEFILTNSGWRNKVLGRILLWEASPTGLVKVTRDLLHDVIDYYSRKGDYAVKKYALTTNKTFGQSIYLWQSQVKDQVNV